MTTQSFEELAKEIVGKLGFEGPYWWRPIAEALQEVHTRTLKEAEEEPKPYRIGMLRQWLNENRITDPNKLVTNKDLEDWLGVSGEEPETETPSERILCAMENPNKKYDVNSEALGEIVNILDEHHERLRKLESKSLEDYNCGKISTIDGFAANKSFKHTSA